jgi:carboxyl-terminal processing protease
MSVNKWILVQMIIIIFLSFFLGYKTSQIETAGVEILPEWIASSSIGEFAFTRTSDKGIITLKDLKEVQQAFEQIQRHFINHDVTKRQLIDGAIAGGVASLNDRYSRYYPPTDSREIQEDLDGFYGGIGIMVEPIQDGRGALITSVFKTGPAFDVGIMAGDIIVEVEGEDVAGMFLHDIVARIKGPENTHVKMKVYRQSIGDNIEIDVERKNVKYPSVFEKKILEGTDGIGYIQLANFNNETSKDFQIAIDELLELGMKSLILDLKQNTGGSFQAAIEIADIFVADGVMVYSESRDGHLIEYPGKDNGDGGKKLDIPLVVLVDMYSASASEVLAGAIKDHDVGTLIGTKTFGKGVIQSVLPQPSNGLLLLTISKYLTPDRHDINHTGIQPNIQAEIDFETTSDPFLKEKYKKAEELRLELIAIRDELMQYLKDYDFPLETAKQYLANGELLEGAFFIEEEVEEEAIVEE